MVGACKNVKIIIRRKLYGACKNVNITIGWKHYGGYRVMKMIIWKRLLWVWLLIPLKQEYSVWTLTQHNCVFGWIQHFLSIYEYDTILDKYVSNIMGKMWKPTKSTISFNHSCLHPHWSVNPFLSDSLILFVIQIIQTIILVNNFTTT